MIKEPLISIIIPVYKVENYLSKCLNSILYQTYNNIEIILIDDGSDDSSGVICDEYAKKDNRIIVIHKAHEGVSIARNVGIKEARGEYITFLDADDMMKQVCISNFLQASNYPMVICGYESFGIRIGYDGPNTSQPITVGKELADRWNSKAETWWWFVWGKLYRRDIIINNNISFKSGMIYLEDFCFVLDYLRHVDKVFLVNSYDILHLIEINKYSKYRMDYPALNNHMHIHENCISMLEKKCNTSFVKMRSKIAIRHIRNFENYLIKSDKSVLEKYKNMYLYKKDKRKPDLFNYFWKGESRKVRLLWIFINLLYILFYPIYFLENKLINYK